MLTWVIYDISNDKIRKKISDLCLNKGLKRVQKSVFLGKINKNQREEIALFCKEKMNKENDSVYIFPMCDKDFTKITLLGDSFNKKVISEQRKTIIL